MIEVSVQSLAFDRKSNTPVVILKDTASDRVLPIWIGPGEASAIAMHLGGVAFQRPLTHDLLVSVVGGMGGTLKRVLITRVENSTYFAELIIDRDGEAHLRRRRAALRFDRDRAADGGAHLSPTTPCSNRVRLVMEVIDARPTMARSSSVE